MKNNTVFVTLMDENFFSGFKVFFVSLLKNNPGFRDLFIILDNEIPNPVKKNMLDVYPNLEFYPLDKTAYRIPEKSTVPRLLATYYKLEVFNPEFYKDYKRVIFMDMDILIQGSIEELKKIDLEGQPFGACKQYHTNTDKLLDHINSGVLVLSPPDFSEGLYTRMLERVERGSYLPDQDIINKELVDEGKVFYLPKEYNVEKKMILSKNFPKAIETAVCLHFIGVKPWEDKSRRDLVFRDTYQRWWDYSHQEDNLNLSRIPLPFRNRNTHVVRNDIPLGQKIFDCFILEEEVSIPIDHLREIIKFNLSEFGYICGFSNPYNSNSNAGKVMKSLLRKPDLYQGGFYLYLKNPNNSKILSRENLSLKVQEEDFKNFLKGKKVVLVGPASSMKGRELGSFIDSFDVVVRTNNMMNSLLDNPELQKDFGTRTDVLYVNVTYERDMLEDWRMEDWVESGLKYVCRTMNSDFSKYGLQVHWRNTLRFPYPPPTLFLGTRAILDLLAIGVESLYVTGMDGYENVGDLVDGKNEEYVEGYLPLLELKRREQRIGKELSRHDRYRDTRIILDLEQEREVLEIDSYCRGLMTKVVDRESPEEERWWREDQEL